MSNSISIDSEDILGYPVTTLNKKECICLFHSFIQGNCRNKYYVGLNPHSIVLADKDEQFKNAILNADIIVPDGTGILLASQIFHGNIRERITGSDIFNQLSQVLNKSGRYRYFFLGANNYKLNIMKSKLNKEFPNITVAGMFAPPFKHNFNGNEINNMVDAINKANPDVLWIGLSAPKQEKWAYQNRDRINVKLICPVGAVFDYYSGSIKRALPRFINLRLEWLWRLAKEPKRLWKRTFISAPFFIYKIIKLKYLGNRKAL